MQGKLILKTARLELRQMLKGDLAQLKTILQDERVMYAYAGPFSEEECKIWLFKQLGRYAINGCGLWGMFLAGTDKMIGQCGLSLQEYRRAQVPEIAYLLAYDYWHQGYATEAALACRDYGFNTLNCERLFSIIRDTNIAAQKVAVRNGMHKIDTIVKHYRGVDMPHYVFVTP